MPLSQWTVDLTRLHSTRRVTVPSASRPHEDAEVTGRQDWIRSFGSAARPVWWRCAQRSRRDMPAGLTGGGGPGRGEGGRFRGERGSGGERGGLGI